VTNIRENSQGFIQGLEKIGEKVDKWPEWKREGWAVLDKEIYIMSGNGEFTLEEGSSSEPEIKSHTAV
jgi:hypothetical protein